MFYLYYKKAVVHECLGFIAAWLRDRGCVRQGQGQSCAGQLPLRNGSEYEHVGAVHQPMGWFCLVCNRYCIKQDFFYGTKQAGRGLTQCLSGCGMMYLCLTITPVKSSNALWRKSPNLTSTRAHAIQILHSPTSQSFCAALSVQLHAKYLSVNMLDPLNLYDML